VFFYQIGKRSTGALYKGRGLGKKGKDPDEELRENDDTLGGKGVTGFPLLSERRKKEGESTVPNTKNVTVRQERVPELKHR